jgi:hypothetical protein
MFHVTSSIVGGLAAVMAWALVAQPFDAAKANIGTDYQHANRAAKGDRITVISKGFVLPQVTVREMSRSTPAPMRATHNRNAAPAIPVGCDPVASPIVEPALARVIGRCLS